MRTAYTPRTDGVAARCITFFRANPDEELSLEDITDKFDATRGNIHTLLAPAREAGLLDRYQNADGEYLYKAGPKIGKADGIDMDAVHNSRSPFGAPQRRRVAVPAVDLPDPRAVTIEDGIPLPGARAKRDWMPLLQRLQPKQSAALPLATLPALGADLEGGTFAGLTTQKDGTHCAVVLLPEKGADPTWKKALAWAAIVYNDVLRREVATNEEMATEDKFSRQVCVHVCACV